jgi:hypothetical protein
VKQNKKTIIKKIILSLLMATIALSIFAYVFILEKNCRYELKIDKVGLTAQRPIFISTISVNKKVLFLFLYFIFIFLIFYIKDEENFIFLIFLSLYLLIYLRGLWVYFILLNIKI